MEKLYRHLICTFLALLSIANVVRAGSDDRKMKAEFVDAVALFNSGDYGAAEQAFIRLNEIYSDDDAVYYYLGMTEAMQDKFSSAEIHLKKAVSMDKSNFWYRHRLAFLYLVTDRPELTELMYEEMIEDFPKRSELYYDMVDLYISRQKYDEALGVLKQIETVFGKNEATALTGFNLLRRMGREREAYESLEKFNEEFSSAQILSILGDYQMSMYNDSTALAYYNEALDIDSKYAPAKLGKAETYRMTRRYMEFFREVNEFVRDKDVAPAGKGDYLYALIQRMDQNFAQTFQTEMDGLIDSSIEVHPKDSSILTTAGLYYYATDREDKSAELLKENVSFWPNSMSGRLVYIQMLIFADKWDELSVEGRKAFEKFPENISFLEMAGLGDFNLKEYDKVIEACNTIVQLPYADSSKVVNAYSTMGDVYYKLGENAKTYKAYEKVLKISPNHCPVLNNYAYFLSVEGKKLKKAYAMSKKTVEKEPDNATYLDTFGWILYLMNKPLEAKPFFKHAMLYGGKDSVVILDHYAEVLYALKEYDLAFVYWKMASDKNNGEIEGLKEKIEMKKAQIRQ